MQANVRRVALAFLLVCSARRSAFAQEGLAYGAVVRDAQVVAPTLAPGRARASTAETGIGVARMITNPIATLGTTTDGPKFVSSLAVPLPITRRQSSIRAAEASAVATSAEIPLLQLDAKLGAAGAWCDLWLAERTLDVARENEGRAASLQTSADQRFKEGTAPRLDAARAAAEHARSHGEVIARTELIADASASLAYWLGRDPAEVVHVTSAPPEVATLPPLATLLQRLPTHPLYARSAARSRAATSAVQAQRSRAWPTFGVQLGATLGDTNAPTNNVSAGLVFDVPVFNWNGAAVTEAERNVAQVAAESDASVARLRADLVSAYAQLRAASARAEVAEHDVLPASQIAADLTRDAYRSGAVDLSAVIVAEKALADAKQAAFDAVAQRGRALAALEHALGGAL